MNARARCVDFVRADDCGLCMGCVPVHTTHALSLGVFRSDEARRYKSSSEEDSRRALSQGSATECRIGIYRRCRVGWNECDESCRARPIGLVLKVAGSQ